MIVAVVRWMFKTRGRGIASLICLASLLGVTLFGWNEFCVWQTRSNLELRQDATARRWLNWQFWQFRSDARLHLWRSKLARRSGQFSDAFAELTAAKSIGADQSELDRELALIRIQTLRFDEFQARDWGKLISDPRDDEPEIAKAYVTWAIARFQFNDAGRILKVWEQDYPADPDPQFLAGTIFSGMSNWEGAEACYRRALKLAPNRADIQFSLASTLKHLLKLDEAIFFHREFLRTQPHSPEAIAELAQALLSQGELGEANEVLTSGLKQLPDHLDLLQALGELRLAEGNAAEAIDPLQRVHAARPESANLASILANALQAAGRADEAKPLFAFVKEAHESRLSLKELTNQMIRNPSDVDVRFKLAEITGKYGSRAEAIRWFRNILHIDPDHLPTHRALAELFELTGDPIQAQQHRQIAKRLSN